LHFVNAEEVFMTRNMTQTRETSRFWLPPQQRKNATALYAQQMWAWGQDIRHPEGNLLRAYGFAYTRQVGREAAGSSQYSLTLNPDWSLTLWSFGLILHTEQQGLFLARHTFRPRWLLELPLVALARPQELPASRKPAGNWECQQTLESLTELARALGAYEKWVNSLYAPAYRQAIMRLWPERCQIPALEMSGHWFALADFLAAESRSLAT